MPAIAIPENHHGQVCCINDVIIKKYLVVKLKIDFLNLDGNKLITQRIRKNGFEKMINQFFSCAFVKNTSFAMCADTNDIHFI